MAEKATVRIHQSDKNRVTDIAEATGRNVADVIADFIREPAWVCPECDNPFDPGEVDGETVEEHGLLSTDISSLVTGERDVKSFECPCCSERVRPSDVETAASEESESEPAITPESGTGEDAGNEA